MQLSRDKLKVGWVLDNDVSYGEGLLFHVTIPPYLILRVTPHLFDDSCSLCMIYVVFLLSLDRGAVDQNSFILNFYQ